MVRVRLRSARHGYTLPAVVSEIICFGGGGGRVSANCLFPGTITCTALLNVNDCQMNK